MRPGPYGAGLSRKAILHEIDESLRRLGTDYVDLYQIHRWDPEVPIEETMEALHDVVRAGKARYLGASSMWAWQFAKAQHVAGRQRLDAVRVDAEPLQPDLPRGGAGDAPALRRPGRRRDPVEPAGARPHHPRLGRRDRAVGDRRVGRRPLPRRGPLDRGDGRRRSRSGSGVSRAQVGLAWLLHQSAVTAPIVGVTKPAHLTDAVAAVDLELSSDDLAELGAGYHPHPVSGHA